MMKKFLLALVATLGVFVSGQAAAQAVTWDSNNVVYVEGRRISEFNDGGIISVTATGPYTNEQAFEDVIHIVFFWTIADLRAKCFDQPNITSQSSASARQSAVVAMLTMRPLTALQVATEKSFTVIWADGGRELYTASNSSPQSLGFTQMGNGQTNGDTGSCSG